MKLAVLPALLVTMAPLGLTWYGRGGEAMAAMLRDPLAVLGQRSPGARADGALLQVKLPRGLARADRGPHERVLSGLRTRPGAPALATPGFGPPPPAEVALLPGGPGEDAIAQGPVPAPLSGFPGFFGGGGVISGGGGGGGTGGGGTGGGGDTMTPPVVTPTPPATVAALPEPATWLTMILGFALMGVALRRPARSRRPLDRHPRAMA